MSLPPALLKRLASRGLVKNSATSDDSVHNEDKTEILENEEIIAEDYDEVDVEYPSLYDSYEPERRTEENFWIERMKLRIGETNVTGYKGCPNKYNIYHKCNIYCVTRWGNGIVEPDKGYLKRKARLLKKYPLPKGWKEIYDPGCGCFYYWNTVNNIVSWLPPAHPKATPTKSAAALRRQLEEVALDSDNGADDDDDDDHGDVNIMPQQLPSQFGSKNQSDRTSRNQYTHNAKKHRNRDLDKMIRQKEMKRYRDKMSRSDSHRDSYHKGDLRNEK